MTHLRLATGADIPSRRHVQWLVRVIQGTPREPVDAILGEAIVDSQPAAAEYARVTYRAVAPTLLPGDPTIVWALCAPTTSSNGEWVASGATLHAVFRDGLLGAWLPGHLPTPR